METKKKKVLVATGAIAGIVGLVLIFTHKTKAATTPGGGGGGGGGGGNLAFTFGIPTVAIVPDTGASAYRTVKFSCTVVNNNSSSVTRTLNVWMETWSIQYGFISIPAGAIVTGPSYDNNSPGTRVVSLQPGESYTYSFNGNYQWNDGNWYAWLIIPVGAKMSLWLQDDLGNKSQVAGPLS